MKHASPKKRKKASLVVNPLILKKDGIPEKVSLNMFPDDLMLNSVQSIKTKESLKIESSNV